jgi:hypothetical protein
VMGISTVNMCHHSSSILRRIGGRPLVAGGSELPSYYEPLYRSNLEILRFDSSSPSERYVPHVERCCADLRAVKVLCRERYTTAWNAAAVLWHQESRHALNGVLKSA